MESSLLLSSVLLPLTEKAGEVAQIEDLLGMLEHCFIDAFKMSLPSDAKAAGAPSSSSSSSANGASSSPSSSSSASIDAGEEAKLMAVRAVTNFHRSGAVVHAAFFQRREYHPHAALFILELLKSLSGNSQQWFRQLQLDSLEACLAIVEVIGVENVRLCLPGVVSVAVRYVHRSHHGKDSSKVCLTALKLLQTALTLSFSSAEPAAWVRETAAHLTNALRSILEPAVLVGGAYGAPVIVALESLISSLLVSPALSGQLSTPLGALLVVALAVVVNMDHLQHLGDDALLADGAVPPDARGAHVTLTAQQAAALQTILRSAVAMTAVQDALQSLRGVELLHVATTAVRLPALRDRFFPLLHASSADAADDTAPPGLPVEVMGPASSDTVVALFLSVVRRCVRLVGTEMNDEALYTHRRPRKYPAGVVDEFLFFLAGALARLPAAEGSDNVAAAAEETRGELLTNALLEEYGAVLQDWDAYAVHPPALYVLTRLVVWQFHPSHESRSAGAAPRDGERARVELQDHDVHCQYPTPSDLITSGAFEQLWSVVAPPHLWNITEDEDLCNNQQIHHRQIIAATLLRFLAMTSDVLAQQSGPTSASTDARAALERLYALTLYLVLEKATASGVVHEAAMRCVDVYSAASHESDAVAFLLHHSSLIVDETARAVREEHLRPAAASVLRGSLAFLEARLTHSTTVTAGSGSDGDGKSGSHFSGSSTQLGAVVRQRLSAADMTALFHRTAAPLASLEEVAQVADFVASTVHVAQDALYLCSRYDSTNAAEDLAGRRAALALLRDALDMAAYLNFCVPQEALDEDQERHTTSAHTRVRALQAVALEAIYTVLQYCTTHDATAPLAVQTVVRGLTSFLTTSTAVEWAEKARQRVHEAEMQRRRKQRETDPTHRRGKKFMDGAREDAAPHPSDTKEIEEEGEEGEEEEEGEGRAALPAAPPLDWPWTHYLSDSTLDAARDGEGGVPSVTIELPRSHLHTVYRVYLSFFAMLREPMAAFAVVSGGAGRRSGMERRKLSDVPITPAVFETLTGLEAIRALACDFLLHRMVEEVLPLVLLWHERGCTPRIPTHTEERLKAATQQFVARLYRDCADSPELRDSMAKQCRGFPLLSSIVAKEDRSEVRPNAEESKTAQATLLVPEGADAEQKASSCSVEQEH